MRASYYSLSMLAKLLTTAGNTRVLQHANAIFPAIRNGEVVDAICQLAKGVLFNFGIDNTRSMYIHSVTVTGDDDLLLLAGVVGAVPFEVDLRIGDNELSIHNLKIISDSSGRTINDCTGVYDVKRKKIYFCFEGGTTDAFVTLTA